MGFEFEKLELDGAYLIHNFHVGDNRGGFTKVFEKDIYKDGGIEFSLNETFTSVSSKNVIRGIHFQTHNPQAKLVSVISGKAIDVIVDLRLNSPTYKKYISVELNEDNGLAIYVPRGFGHGFCTLEDKTIMLYMCDGKYDKATDTGIIYNDKDLDIKWPIDEKDSIHSSRDLSLMSLKDYENNPMIV